MRTITGLFANAEAADSAAQALEEAGVTAANIDVDRPEQGDTILSATVEDEMVDAAHAVLQQSGARSVEETETRFETAAEIDEDVEGDEAALMREPPPIITPMR